MLLENVSKQDIQSYNAVLQPKLMKEPMFMFCCPEISKRADFINAYFSYYIYEWSRYDTLLVDSERTIVASLVDPDTFAYKYKGKGARGMKKFKNASAVFVHRENLEEIVDILIPPARESRVLNLYANPEIDIVAMNELVDEAIEMALKDNFVLIYESLSRKMVGLLEHKGFAIASQKQFLNTQFIETVMTFNM